MSSLHHNLACLKAILKRMSSNKTPLNTLIVFLVSVPLRILEKYLREFSGVEPPNNGKERL